MYASTMIAFTPKGARYLLNDMKNAEPQHVDYYLLNFLRRCEQNDSPVKGSYICPAFGNYVEHESQSTAHFGLRKSLWHVPGVQPGTRPYHASHEHRWVMGFGAKKNAKKSLQMSSEASTRLKHIEMANLGKSVSNNI